METFVLTEMPLFWLKTYYVLFLLYNSRVFRPLHSVISEHVLWTTQYYYIGNGEACSGSNALSGLHKTFFCWKLSLILSHVSYNVTEEPNLQIMTTIVGTCTLKYNYTRTWCTPDMQQTFSLMWHSFTGAIVWAECHQHFIASWMLMLEPEKFILKHYQRVQKTYFLVVS